MNINPSILRQAATKGTHVDWVPCAACGILQDRYYMIPNRGKLVCEKCFRDGVDKEKARISEQGRFYGSLP